MTTTGRNKRGELVLWELFSLQRAIIGLALLAFQVGGGYGVVPEGTWGSSCRVPCTCEMSPFSELPLTTRLLDLHPGPQGSQSSQGNEATYENDGNRTDGEQLKMAVCVLLPGIDPNNLLLSLPTDLQVLTLLQGRGAGPSSVGAEALAHFAALEVLDVQGLAGSPDRLAIGNHALAQLPTLRYFSAEYVHLEPEKHDASNEIGRHIGNDIGNDIGHPPPERPDGPGRLVFLEPVGNEIPVVSFTEFKQQRQAKTGERLFSFAVLPSLLYLRVHACGLRELAWEMFRGLAQLETLSLEQNDLLFIPEFVLYGTPALKSLSLAGNQLLGLEDTALAGLFHLETLDLSANNFSHLSELSLPPFPKLRAADFRSNPVAAVYPGTFEIMNATAELFLGGADTPLALLPNSFVGLRSLRRLVVENARVPRLETELLRGMPLLVELDVTGDIASIAFDAFLAVPQLRRLSLRRCRLAHVSMDAFYGLRSLLALDLSENALTGLPPGIFDQQVHIEEISLRNNQLTTLPADLLSRSPAKMIRLDGNPWHCTCDMRGWKATVINKVKNVEGPRATSAVCAAVEGKGTACPASAAHMSRYAFDKKVSPRCATPVKYRDWNVFHLLRKELRCGRSPRDDKRHKSDYILRKHAAYYGSLKTMPPSLDAEIESSRGKSNSSEPLDPAKSDVVADLQSSPAIETTTQGGENVVNVEKKTTSFEKKTKSFEKKTTSPSPSIEEKMSLMQREDNRKEEKAISPVPLGNASAPPKYKKEKISYVEKIKTVSQASANDNSPNQKDKNEKPGVYAEKISSLPSSLVNQKEEKRKDDETATSTDNEKENAKLFKKSWKLEAEKKRLEKLKGLKV